MEDSGMVGAVEGGVSAAPLPAMFTRYRGGFLSDLKGAMPEYKGHTTRPEDHIDPLYDMLAYHMGWADRSGWPVDGSQAQGKALRPTLCMFACESLGGDWTQASPAASALELVHNFSLIHDDIQDGDVERRHQPTVWYLWGEPQALIAGNALRSVADRTALRLSRLNVPMTKALRASQILTQGYLEMTQGQCLDLSFEGRLDIGPGDYLEMVYRKTGALIRCGTEIGALVATDDAVSIRRYAEAGAYLGVAFQVQDDVLGIWGDEAATGKAAGNDILRRKKSFPVVYALENATGAGHRKLVDVYSKEELMGQDVADVLTVLDNVGAESYSQQAAEERAGLALEQVRKIPLEPWAAWEFEELVHFLTARQY